MKVLVSGASGLLGSALVPFLRAAGHDVRTLGRSARADVRWDLDSGVVDTASLDGFDAVIHLAGESIGEGRWTEGKKRRITESRSSGTRLLAAALASVRTPPHTLVCSSAVGIYGDRGDEVLTESSLTGRGFLAEVVMQWEGACRVAVESGIRVVNLRFGVILARNGGFLGPILPPFRLGLGGPLGGGRQYLSWLAMEDVLGIAEHVLSTDTLTGPVNATSPNPVTNREFTRSLANALHRPALIPLPKCALRAMFGREKADGLLLASHRTIPEKLLRSGYQFQFPDLEPALMHVLGQG